jgi:hypothetical protein
MKSKLYLILLPLALVMLAGCGGIKMKNQQESTVSIEKGTIENVIKSLSDRYGDEQRNAIERGVNQIAALWWSEDGTADEFADFCNKNFISDSTEKDVVFRKLLAGYETINGNMLRIKKDLMRPLHLDLGAIHNVDVMFGSYEPGAHVREDFFKNKIAFFVALNFPYFTFEEKTEMGKNWTRKEWAKARIGDYYTSRVPARLIQQASAIETETDNYIAEYNIYMGKLMNEKGESLFPENLRLITHWGLRDELKSNYADDNGLEKQKMVYAVMKRIIDQSIPQSVINKDQYQWNPMENKLFDNGKTIEFSREPDTRYRFLLDNFLAQKSLDPYYPQAPDYIQRTFNNSMEISQPEVEAIFTAFISSPQVKDVAGIISARLGRPLEPFDIWYNGFKAGGNFSEEELDKIVRQRYPNVQAFQNDLERMLLTLGFERTDAKEITSKIKVEGARGAGHAWGGQIKDDKALLRTRIGNDGMDYKGYNIAIHEYGHNVEQTISLHNVDYYSLNGVPNTAFTEALAFIFQKRDLELLGLKDNDPIKEHIQTLANFWSCYEIMGVSLVDMNVWKWMYANPDATPAQLKEATINIAKDVWNKYYAPVFGSNDEPILAVYSHMISNPLYLSNYPLGHVIDFQIEQYISDKDFATEITRIFQLGTLLPQQWMNEAVGMPLSIEPTLAATTKAVQIVKQNDKRK